MTNTNGTFRISKQVTISYRDFITTILSNGLNYFEGYGFMIDTSFYNFYEEAKDKLKQQGLDTCLEDVWAQILLDGGELVFKDVEGDDAYTTALTLDKVEKTLWKFLDESPSDAFTLAFDRVYHEEGDAEDCDVLLQYILFGEYLFS